MQFRYFECSVWFRLKHIKSLIMCFMNELLLFFSLVFDHKVSPLHIGWEINSPLRSETTRLNPLINAVIWV